MLRLVLDLFKDMIAFGQGVIPFLIGVWQSFTWPWKVMIGVCVLRMIPWWITQYVTGSTDDIRWDFPGNIMRNYRTILQGTEVVITMKRTGRKYRGRTLGYNYRRNIKIQDDNGRIITVTADVMESLKIVNRSEAMPIPGWALGARDRRPEEDDFL